ncbi:hypothetical protein [Cytobacillus depressus]|uniref:hypothetical protein n=1 Tax=Cytobacillus depressus TaxID=1602942 RepID=UPI001478AE9B|nr:hypothetical protein [Cytobacillus depressus]
MSLDEARDTDYQMMIDQIPILMDRHSAVFIFKTLCVSVDERGGFVIVDRLL